jgi:hypothetical protein
MSDDNTANKNYYKRLAQEHAELDDPRVRALVAPRLTYEQMLEAETPVTIINEPVDFAVEEPQRESATARAMRRWFKDEGRPVS